VSNLKKSYSFDSFIVDESNHMAYQIMKNISDTDSGIKLPIYLFGEHCVGKTHLMQALANSLQMEKQNVLYVPCEKIIRDFLRHLSNRTMDRFKAKYYDCDYLLIEGVFSLAAKYSMQEEIANILHWFEIEKKCIILSADVSPQYLKGFDETLLNQFDKSIFIKLDTSSDELKKKIVEQKLQENNVTINPKQIQALVEDNLNLCQLQAQISLLGFKRKFMM